ncbi:GTP-binding protein A [Triangularia verruculosa]|uniref:GTP-binding protein A n=1 Tax=Triangularia verruculosa TaxID=2587418 RepID=A0AAN6XGV1_9PEZI|nr:GTP-binding protein A [Triangularia verruculosa]
MTQPVSHDILVVIIGVTGAGKTTFANLASGGNLLVGHGLDPCTQDPQAVQFMLDGHNITLIDTPGFDDDGRNDLEIFEGIGRWLVKQGFAKNQPLDGVIILHPITHSSIGNMEKKRTRLLEKILGQDAYKRVVITTTMWTAFRQGAFQNTWTTRQDQIWRNFMSNGAVLIKHDNTRDSAHGIIRSIILKSEAGRARTLLQTELTSKKRFTETTVGEDLKRCFEEEIEHIEEKLLKHRLKRPPDAWRKSTNFAEKWEWWEWESAYQDLEKSLELLQMQLKTMNRVISRLLGFWARIFR